MHEAHDINPVFSPDGQWIAFSSNRHGSYDVFVVPAVRRQAAAAHLRLGHDMVTGWTPDGKNVVFASTAAPTFPASTELYTVPVEGGPRAEARRCSRRKDGAFSPDGRARRLRPRAGHLVPQGLPRLVQRRHLARQRRRHERRRLTDVQRPGQLARCGARTASKLYYVSEFHGGPANIVCQDLTRPPARRTPSGSPKQLTTHEDDAVRRARISGNGEWIVYECGADLWVVGTQRRRTPRKLAIEVHADDKSNTERTVTFTSDATEFALSPDEKHVAFVVHGELFLHAGPDGGKADAADRHAGVTTTARLVARTARRSSSSPTATATRTSTCSSPTTPSTRS